MKHDTAAQKDAAQNMLRGIQRVVGDWRDLFVVEIALLIPLAALIAKNPSEPMAPVALRGPVLLLGIVGGVFWLLASVVAGRDNRPLRFLSSIVFCVWFSAFGILAAELQGTAADMPVLADGGLTMAMLTGTAVTALLLVRRFRASLAGAARLVRNTILILAAFQVVQLTLRDSPTWTPDVSDLTPHGDAISDPPDVYFVLLDSYSGNRSLLANYGYDNTGFVNELRARGFSVPRSPHGNYPATFLALASMLNWQYLGWLGDSKLAGSRDRTLPYSMIENSRAVQFFKKAGYRTYFLRSRYGGTSLNRYADVVLPASAEWEAGSALPLYWIRSTAIFGVVQIWCEFAYCPPALPFDDARQTALKFDLLASLAAEPGPKFVFAHFMVPHEPYVFSDGCSAREPIKKGYPGVSDHELRQAYVDQVQCVNSKVLDVIDTLVARSPRDPVIILQSDHGHALIDLGRPPAMSQLSEEQLEERFDVFAAYHLPHAPAGVIYDSISPVNVLPAVLRTYFDVPIASLPDKRYYSAWQRPYRFIPLDVNDQ